MISFDGLYTREQLRRGLWLATHPRGLGLILRLAAALLVVGGLGFIAYGLISGQVTLGRVARTVVLLVLIGAWVVLPYVNAWQTANRSWRASGGAFGLSGTVGDGGLVLNRSDGRGNVDQPWDVFVRAHLEDDLVVLVGVDHTATILPRSFFSDEGDWHSFRQFVEFNVVTPS
ncbi:MAG: hypothetical protein P8129_15160 [Anaerolineae bacterium]